MPRFSQRSKQNRDTVHPLLQDLLNEAIKNIDFTIIQGRRGREKQQEAYQDGKTQLNYPESKHNASPSLAVDVVPYPINWEATERFTFLQGFLWGMAEQMDIPVRLGMDWDGDGNLITFDPDEDFMDAPHIELDITYDESSSWWPEDDSNGNC